jgi:hypothetical protein
MDIHTKLTYLRPLLTTFDPAKGSLNINLFPPIRDPAAPSPEGIAGWCFQFMPGSLEETEITVPAKFSFLLTVQAVPHYRKITCRKQPGSAWPGSLSAYIDR